MNNVVALQPERSHDLTAPQLDLVKRTVAKDCNRDEFDMFIAVCKRVGLDPFRRQINAVIYNKDKVDKRQMVLITAIDGLRAIAARAGNYRPDENPPEIILDESYKDPKTNPRGIVSATVKPWKLGADGHWYQISGQAYWEEFAPLIEGVEWVDTGDVWQDSGKPKKEKRPTGEFTLDPKNSFWRKMPNIMLAKCAEAQALRKGWPEDMSGIYVREEMHQAETANASDIVEDHAKTERLKYVGAHNNIMIQWRAGEELQNVPVGEFADKCFSFFKESESATELTAWKNRNKAGLQSFWAQHQSDALQIKKVLELTIEKLSQA